jgi:hypothetical protein
MNICCITIFTECFANEFTTIPLKMYFIEISDGLVDNCLDTG